MAERHEALYSMPMNSAAVNMRAAGCCGEYGKLGQERIKALLPFFVFRKVDLCCGRFIQKNGNF